jgi:coproporphyrinogen III oxidase
LVQLCKPVGNSFLTAYVPIVEKKKTYPYPEQRTGKKLKRSLRGVQFGSRQRHFIWPKTNGRIESILMSLPPHVQWVYDHHPEVGSEEENY